MKRVAILFFALALMPLSAHAYFDPGAGAVLLQLLVATGIGFAYKLRHWFANLIRTIRGFFKR